MNDSAQHSKPPSPKQIKYLKDLAEQTGRSFTWPSTSSQASAQINQLKALEKTSAAERRRERRDIQADMTRERDSSSRVRDDEVSGFGSSARWRRS